MKVSIVIPTKNEAEAISGVIAEVRPYADEILVVDGHSTDDTRRIAQELGARVILDGGKGKGDGLRCAAAQVSGEIMVFVDADGSSDTRDIPRLVEPIKAGRADLVIGSRSRGGSDELHGDLEKLLRVLGSDIILVGTNWRFKACLTDTQCGFRAILTAVFRDLGLRENITTIEQEMTMKCLKKGYRVGEVPSHEFARKYGVSRICLRKVWFRYLWSFLVNLI
jgi:dolichol-phosphate mannosyltransferase